MLISDWRAELLFGEKQVLAKAKELVNDKDITRCEMGMVEYFHILFDQHEIIWAEDCLSESFYISELSLSAQNQQQREELETLFPTLTTDGTSSSPLARMALKSHEVSLLAAI